MKIKVDYNIYDDSCITKAVYVLADRYTISRQSVTQGEILEIIPHKEDVVEESVKSDVIDTLNDYKLRQQIERETHDIRVILYAKAFGDIDEVTEDI